MANKTIPDLTAATVMNDADLVITSQGGVTKKLLGSVVKDADKLDGAHASTTPGAGVIPIADADSMLGDGWIDAAALWVIIKDLGSINASALDVPSIWTAMLTEGYVADVRFAAHKNSVDQVIPAATETKITFATELFDVGSCFSSSRFTPDVAGKYQVNFLTMLVQAGDGDATSHITLFKNEVAHFISARRHVGVFDDTHCISTIVDMNGSTDYLEVSCYCTPGATVNGAVNRTIFSASFVGV